VRNGTCLCVSNGSFSSTYFVWNEMFHYRILHALIHVLYYSILLTPWCRFLLEKLTGLQLVKKFPSFHGTRKFITALTSVRTSRMWIFLNRNVLQGGIISTSPNPQAGGQPLVGRLRLLIQFIRSYPPYRRPFLYPQPEDAPCRGDRDPLHVLYNIHYYSLVCCKNSAFNIVQYKTDFHS